MSMGSIAFSESKGKGMRVLSWYAAETFATQGPVPILSYRIGSDLTRRCVLKEARVSCAGCVHRALCITYEENGWF